MASTMMLHAPMTVQTAPHIARALPVVHRVRLGLRKISPRTTNVRAAANTPGSSPPTPQNYPTRIEGEADNVLKDVRPSYGSTASHKQPWQIASFDWFGAAASLGAIFIFSLSSLLRLLTQVEYAPLTPKIVLGLSLIASLKGLWSLFATSPDASEVGLLKWGTPVAWGGVLGYLAWTLFGYFVNTPHSVATAATGYPFWVLALTYSAAASGLTYAFWRLSSASSETWATAVGVVGALGTVAYAFLGLQNVLSATSLGLANWAPPVLAGIVIGSVATKGLANAVFEAAT